MWAGRRVRRWGFCILDVRLVELRCPLFFVDSFLFRVDWGLALLFILLDLADHLLFLREMPFSFFDFSEFRKFVTDDVVVRLFVIYAVALFFGVHESDHVLVSYVTMVWITMICKLDVRSCHSFFDRLHWVIPLLERANCFESLNSLFFVFLMLYNVFLNRLQNLWLDHLQNVWLDLLRNVLLDLLKNVWLDLLKNVWLVLL